MLTLSEFIDGFMTTDYIENYLKQESEKYKHEDGSYMGWDAGKVMNIQEQLQNELIEIYDSFVDNGETLDKNVAKEVYDDILNSQYQMFVDKKYEDLF